MTASAVNLLPPFTQPKSRLVDSTDKVAFVSSSTENKRIQAVS